MVQFERNNVTDGGNLGKSASFSGKMVVLERASEAWRLLNGVFCIYKPSGITFPKLRHLIADNLVRDLNNMKREIPPPLVKIEAPSEETEEYRITTIPDLRRHPLLVGPGYSKDDFFIQTQKYGLTEMAGVVPCSIGNGSKVFHEITGRNPICAYHIQGKFGLRTDNYMESGRVIEKTTFDFITKGAVERFLSFYQGQYQKRIAEAYGTDPNSQETYEMHASGLLRPGDSSIQLVYKIKCIDFKSPYFTLEIHCVNETDKFLVKILNDVAENLKSSAVCTKIRRIRFGNLTLDHALIRKHWTVEGVIKSISVCGPAVLKDIQLLQEPFLTKVEKQPELLSLTS